MSDTLVFDTADAHNPRPISELFSPGPETVDAVVSYTYKTRWIKRVKFITYLFKANLVWKYEYKREYLLKPWQPKVFVIFGGYPKTIKEDFGINVQSIDAAFKLKKKNALYLTKRNAIWEVQIQRSKLKPKRPRRISKDPALSYLPPLDSAAVFENDVFTFFSGDYYHQLVPFERNKARWLWPRYTLNSLFMCNLSSIVPFNNAAKPVKDFVKEIQL